MAKTKTKTEEAGIERHLLTEIEINEKDPQVKLAQQAASKLGYKILKEAVFNNELRNVLADLEIEILDQDQVKKYMTKKVKDNGWGYSYRWNKIAISQYKRPIPEFVLHKAVQIKTRLPKCEINVHELVRRRSVDPFLSVTLGKETYFVEVWNEPKFEKVMQ